MNNIVVVFEYEDAWMIYLYQNGEEQEYWSCDEHMWDNVWDYLDLIKETKDLEIIEPKFKTFEEIIAFKKENDIDTSKLKESDFEKLRKIQ